MVGHASFLTASHKGPFIPNQVRGAGGIWTGGGGGPEKKYGFKYRLMVFLAITTTISTSYLATSGSVFLVFRVTYCIEWQ